MIKSDVTLLALYLEGKVFANEDLTKFSDKAIDGYTKWEEVAKNKFPGYELKDYIISPKEAPIYTFAYLRELFLQTYDPESTA